MEFNYHYVESDDSGIETGDEEIQDVGQLLVPMDPQPYVEMDQRVEAEAWNFPAAEMAFGEARRADLVQRHLDEAEAYEAELAQRQRVQQAQQEQHEARP